MASITAQPTLSLEDVRLSVGQGRTRTTILRDVSLDVRPGEVVGLVGESGAGKTMIGRLVLGLEPKAAYLEHGTVTFEGLDLLADHGRARHALLGKRIALIPQDPMSALNPVHRIERQLCDVLRMHLGMNAAKARARALELLDAVHLPNPARVLRQFPHELSGGMRQRVLIAIAFACDPALIIADEPTTALDVTVQRQVLRLIREMQHRAGTAILFVTHDLGVVAKLADRVVVLHAGRVLETGATEDVLANPAHAYTRALLAATPRFDRPADALVPVSPELNAQLLAEAAASDDAFVQSLQQ